MTELRTLELAGFELLIATGAGPRIVGFRAAGRPQLFADLDDLMLEHPGIPDYPLLGGHRLWRAPEVPPVTYEPDDRPVSVVADGNEISIEGAAESDGLVKQLVLRARGKHVLVDHILRNDSWTPIECAPWAITQMIPGGTAVLPQAREPVDVHGVQPNRSVVLWPYTDPAAPEIVWGRDLVLVLGSADPSPLKLGQANDRGWIAYAAEGELFVKWADLHRPGERYLDRDATMQVYRSPRFVELESMGPPRRIAPGTSISHRETWAIFEVGDVEATDLSDAIRHLQLPSTPPEA